MSERMTAAPDTPLSALPVTVLPGIGEYRAKALAEAGVKTIEDLLHYFPRRYLDRSTIVPMTELYRFVGQTVTSIGRVTGIVLLGRGRKRLVVTLRDERGSMDLVFFQGIQYWQSAFHQDETLAVSGEVAVYGRRPNIVHPEIDRLPDDESLDFINTGGIIPVYPSGAGLEKVGLNRAGGFRRIIHTALQRFAPRIEDHFSDSAWATHASPDASPDASPIQIPLREAIETIHRPPSQEALKRARRRLVFDEFFLLSLQMAYHRRSLHRQTTGIAFNIESPTARELVRTLPFHLTGAQKRVIREIAEDMRKAEPMNRLLQGDVGSGKTVVALLSMLVTVDNGCQCALMAPTEILAEQHYRTLTGLLSDLRVNIRLLTGQIPQAQRDEILAGLAGGTVHIVVGTHALIQSDVDFARLGFVVIDEQHRFGVLQRASLRGKGAAPDVLIMSATPIPRTLTMTLYGDLDVSTIDEMPPGRKRVKTAVRFEEDRAEVLAFVREEVARGSQVYFVFPLVSESEKLDLKAAAAEYEKLSTAVYPDLRVGLLHGQMGAKEKDEVMTRFKRGEIAVLVSTTVIEVGIDVPNASVMVVEHAERFGLAQLHQLRGRVGRGTSQAYCILMTSKAVFFGGRRRTGEEQKEASDARRRLETMRDSVDGFRIAEVDMEIRGPGDLWGTQQSGFPELRIASLLTDGIELQEARAMAFRIVEEDPQLRLPEHEGILRILGPRLRARMQMAGVA